MSATQLGAIALQGALKQSGVSPTKVSSVFMGCVLSAGLGQSPARQASLQARISVSTPTTHINKVCGSALQAILNGVQELMLQDNGRIIAAGGMENMTNAPYLLTEARQGYRLGDKRIVDHLLFDGLEDAASHQVMGVFAEKTAEKYGFTREMQDQYALESATRTLKIFVQQLDAEARLVGKKPSWEELSEEEREVLANNWSEEDEKEEEARLQKLRDVFATALSKGPEEFSFLRTCFRSLGINPDSSTF